MKIVYISDSIIPSRSAYSIHVMRMCQALVINGHKVFLLTPNMHRRKNRNINEIFDYYGVDKCFEIIFLSFPHFKGKNLVYSIAILRNLFHIKPEKIIGRYIFGCTIASIFRFQTIFEWHAPIWKENRLFQISFRFLIKSKSFEKLVVISKALKDMYISKKLLSDQKITVLHDSADEIPDFLPINNWPGRANVLQVGYVGHLYLGRGINIIIECAKQLNDIDFHIIGGLDRDIDYWRRKVTLKNVFIHGHISPRDVYKYRNTCDILLAPYENVVTVEGKGNTSAYMSPLKIFEYMASKKVIIASDLPVIREILHEKNSVLVPPNALDRWIYSIKLLNDIKLRESLAYNAYNDFIKYYTWNKRAKLVLT